MKQVVHRKPDGPAPVGVAAEEARGPIRPARIPPGTPARCNGRRRDGPGDTSTANGCRRARGTRSRRARSAARAPAGGREGIASRRRPADGAAVWRFHVGNVLGQVPAVLRNHSRRLLEAGQPSISSSSSTSTASSGMSPTIERTAAASSGRRRAAGRSRSRPPRSTARCRRACSWRRRCATKCSKNFEAMSS